MLSTPGPFRRSEIALWLRHLFPGRGHAIGRFLIHRIPPPRESGARENNAEEDDERRDGHSAVERGRENIVCAAEYQQMLLYF